MGDYAIFDPDDCLLPGSRSPELEPVKPSFRFVKSPLPLADQDSSEDQSGDEKAEDSQGATTERARRKCAPQ